MAFTMKCNSLEKEQLIPLRDALNNLIRFLQKWKDSSIPYFFRYLQYMKDNIEICIYTQDDWGDGLVYLEDILQQNWNDANDDFWGIHSCELFGEGQRELFLQYLGLLEEVEQYFIFEIEQL